MPFFFPTETVMEILNLTGRIIDKSNLVDNVIEIADVAYNDSEEQNINAKVEKFLSKEALSTEQMYMAARVVRDMAHSLEVEAILVDVAPKFVSILDSSLRYRRVKVLTPEELTSAA